MEIQWFMIYSLMFGRYELLICCVAALIFFLFKESTSNNFLLKFIWGESPLFFLNLFKSKSYVLVNQSYSYRIPEYDNAKYGCSVLNHKYKLGKYRIYALIILTYDFIPRRENQGHR